MIKELKLQTSRENVVSASFSKHGQAQVDGVDLEKMLGIFRRQWRLVVICAACSLILGVVYLFLVVPRYTASASLIIDKGNAALVNRLTMVDNAAADEATMLSQVEIIKSEAVGLAVVDSLNLGENADFMTDKVSLSTRPGRLLSYITSIGQTQVNNAPTTPLHDRNRRIALGKVLGGMNVVRVGRTYVLDVSYTSASPIFASQVANAIADAYIMDRLNSKYDATRRASEWLQTRLEDLKEKSLESDLAVQKFKTQNGLMSTGGTLITDQQLTLLNSQLIDAQSQTATAKAKYDGIHQIVEQGQSDAIVSDALVGSVSNDLRQKYLADSKLEADISKRLGPNHVRAVELRNEMNEYKRLMFQELTRYEQSYKSDYDVALARQSSIEDSIALAQGASAVAGTSAVQLRELERAAQTYSDSYQSFLQKYQASLQQQSLPTTEARVITRSIRPHSPSYPDQFTTLAAFIFFGLSAGSTAAWFKEARDRFYRTGEQVRSDLKLDFIGYSPVLEDIRAPQHAPSSPSSFTRSNAISAYSIDHPLSPFTETLRSAKMSLDSRKHGNKGEVIGVVSTLPGEGKSTISMNLAELLAVNGARTILIDCDLRNPGATRALGSHANVGLVEVLTEQASVADLILQSNKTDLVFLPAVVRRRLPHSSQLLDSSKMDDLLSVLKDSFEYIVLDLPPLAPVLDAKIIARKVDSYLYVIEWGKTNSNVIRSTLRSNREIAVRCAGVILNKADGKKMGYYADFGTKEYYRSRYHSYYAEY